MEWLQIWEWGIWPWLGNVIASQAFLTLMVPVATLTGVLSTNNNNDRIRRRELQGEREQWRYEELKNSAADQRREVVNFLAEVFEIQSELSKQVEEDHEKLATMGGLKDGEYDRRLIELKWRNWCTFRSKVSQSLLTLELSLADENVRVKASRIRQIFDEEEKTRFPRSLEDIDYTELRESEFMKSSSPMSEAVETALEDLKKTAISCLHPALPEGLVIQPSRRWLAWHKRKSLPAGNENTTVQEG